MTQLVADANRATDDAYTYRLRRSPVFQRAAAEFARHSWERARERAWKDDQTLRRLLGRWVSELEPSAVYSQDGRLIGLSDHGGSLVIKVEDLQP